MHRKTKFLIGLFATLSCLILLLPACNDIIAKDISEETPVLILPGANDTISSNPVQFKWEEMEGATKYKLEVVQPSFSNIQSYVLDSIVTGTNFIIDLDSNVYEYRLTALNAGYESKTSAIRSFYVGTSQGSSSSAVTLIGPANNLYVNEDFNGVFSWYGMSGASSYTFELHKTATFAGATLDYVDQLGTTSLTSFTGAQLDEGTYCWGVKAFFTAGTETAYTKRVFYVDTVNPQAATLSSPLNNANVTAGSVSFTWIEPTNTGTVQSPIYSVLEISTTSNFSSILTPTTLQGNTTNYTLTAGTYYWRIRTKDEAGNWGTTPTNSRTLYVL